jgi:protein O-mannosyl-transferase
MRSAPRLAKKVDRVEVGPVGVARHFWWMAGLLVLVSLVAFWPVLGNGFVDIDDEDCFVRNRHLVEPAGALIRWAWTSYLQGLYQPLARMLHGLEAWPWGVDPAVFHAWSLAMHAANAVALFAMTVALIRLGRPSLASERPGLVLGLSALSVGLFVAHPLRSEVVAWATVQAYEPSALFAMLSVLAYLRAGVASGVRRLAWFAGSVALFAVSLGFYGIAVCLPLVLLVLDVYPLGRVAPGRCSWREAAMAVLEKVPYFALSLVFAALTYRSRTEMGVVTSLAEDGLGARVASSCYGACWYLIKTLVPMGLGPIHPMPDRVGLLVPAFALSVLAVVGISFASFRLRRSWPALGVAWASFLLLQLPTSGLVKFASTIAADRYTYITMLGCPALMTAGLCTLLAGRRTGRASLAAVWMVGGVAAVGLVGLSRAESLAWRDSVSIWSHVAASHDRPEGWFESRIGRALADRGRLDEAEVHLEEAIRLSPGFGYAQDKLGLVLVAKGRMAEAFPHFAEAVRLEPNHVESRINLGFAFVQLGRFPEAASQLAEAVRLRPELPEAQANLGAVLVHLGRPAEAEVHLAEALRLAPDRPGGRMDLAYALAQQRKFDQAAELYAEQVRRHPDDPNARHNLAAVLDQLGRRVEAREQDLEARRLAAGQAAARTR